MKRLLNIDLVLKRAEVNYRRLVENRSSEYKGQFKSDWLYLRKHDKAKPAIDLGKIAAGKVELGMRRDGTYRKFTASEQYKNWPTNRVGVRPSGHGLDYHDIHPLDSGFWEARLASEGMPAELDAMSSSEFNKLENRVAYVDRPKQSMTGVVLDSLWLRPMSRERGGPQSVAEQYKTWLHTVKMVAYKQEIEALATASNPPKPRELVELHANRPLKVKRINGQNKRKQLLAMAKQAREASAK